YPTAEAYERACKVMHEAKAEVRRLREERDLLRDLVVAWEPRVLCPQCGLAYDREACGPTHASIYALVQPAT
ncbi:MAG: hypothetical protein LC687_00590, partial [Actinobacteria bacterium]|nr:hypothetical protein [Actinomycetota bacterium]